MNGGDGRPTNLTLFVSAARVPGGEQGKRALRGAQRLACGDSLGALCNQTDEVVVSGTFTFTFTGTFTG